MLHATFTKIISSGQTGVDRAALDVAIKLGIPSGGWCPKGRRAADGRIPDKYDLVETGSFAYATRTRLNVRAADGTLVLTRGRPSGGTKLTVALAREMDKPLLTIDLDKASDPGLVVAWARSEGVKVLNVAGPRESEHPGIHEQAVRFLRDVLAYIA